jgi:hypothetical protein
MFKLKLGNGKINSKIQTITLGIIYNTVIKNTIIKNNLRI